MKGLSDHDGGRSRRIFSKKLRRALNGIRPNDIVYSVFESIWAEPLLAMKLSIISLKGIEFEGEVNSVNLKTTSGEITVLDHHRPIVTALSSGKLSVVKKDGDRVSFNINSGFLEVDKDGQATILTG